MVREKAAGMKTTKKSVSIDELVDKQRPCMSRARLLLYLLGSNVSERCARATFVHDGSKFRHLRSGSENRVKRSQVKRAIETTEQNKKDESKAFQNYFINFFRTNSNGIDVRAYQGHERVGRGGGRRQVACAAGFQERLGHFRAVGQGVDQNVNLAVVRLKRTDVW